MTSALDELRTTREALHQVAEHVLAAAQFAETGDVRLAYVPGGFSTSVELQGGRRVMVIDDELVVVDPVARRTARLTTIAEAAAFVGITAGLPSSAYPPATSLRPDAGLAIDQSAATRLAGWYGLADVALRDFSTDVGAGEVQPTLWPEHFDLAIALDGVNYGASPGDEHVEQPYVYVGPHGGPPRRDEFWNAEFGAVATIAEVGSPDVALGFFLRGRSEVEA
jgi:hypothetical protein